MDSAAKPAVVNPNSEMTSEPPRWSPRVHSGARLSPATVTRHLSSAGGVADGHDLPAVFLLDGVAGRGTLSLRGHVGIVTGRLGDFLKGECRHQERWHCSTLPADWCIALGYPDFAAEWRGVFEPALCDATACAAGGLVRLWDRGIGTSLPEASSAPQPGDICVLTALGVEAGGIWTGERWAVRSARGLAFLGDDRLRVLKAWRPNA